MCGGSFLAMAGDMAGVGLLPLMTYGDITRNSCLTLSSAYDLGKKPDPLYKGEAVRDFYQKMTIFLGMIH